MRTTEMVLFAHFLKTSKFIPACISIYILSLAPLALLCIHPMIFHHSVQFVFKILSSYRNVETPGCLRESGQNYLYNVN